MNTIPWTVFSGDVESGKTCETVSAFAGTALEESFVLLFCPPMSITSENNKKAKMAVLTLEAMLNRMTRDH